MLGMLEKELVVRRDFLHRSLKIQTIYFGGGTPSLLSASELGKLLEAVSRNYPLDLKEVTLEANPDDLSPTVLRDFQKIGINRLSIGIQSFHGEILSFYNRAHDQDQSHRVIELAKDAGFDKLSIDLIYGYPATSHQLWKSDLEIALSKDPGHISSYALTIEPKTVFGHRAKKGTFIPPSEDFLAEQYEWLLDQTEKAGYLDYEISNFAKPDELAIHNSNYWKGIPYLGIGPSAHSFDGKDRGANIANNPIYIKNMLNSGSAYYPETLSHEESANEHILTSLRTIWGLDGEFFRSKYGWDIINEKAKELAWLSKNNWIEVENKTITLSRKGKLLADSIAARLFY